MFKRTLSALLAAATIMSFAACTQERPEPSTAVTASDGTDEYLQLFESRVDTMPDSLVIAMGDDAAEYGVDMSLLLDNEGFIARADDGNVVLLGKNERGIDRAVRHFTTYGNFDSYSFTYGEGYKVKSLTVMGAPISDFAVIIPADADACMTFGASELVKYIKIATGVELQVYSADEYSGNAAHTITFAVDFPGHGDEAFSIDVTENGDINVLCGRYRGGMYAAYGLLRDIGWRFLADGKEYIYEADVVDLTEAIDRKEEAAIPYRFASAYPIEFNSAYGTRLGIHARYSDGHTTKTYGGYGLVAEACHGLYSVDWKGLYPFKSGQPCFTDELILQTIEDHCRAEIESKLNAGCVVGYDFNYIDVAQLDVNSFCICETCLEVLKVEKYQSGAVLRMTNRIADMAAEYDPDIAVLMLAYQKTSKAPLVTRPRDNVVVAHCFFAGDGKVTCSNHCVSGDDCVEEKFITNKTFGSEIEEWEAICKKGNLQAWYYPMDGGDEPSSLTPCYDTAFEDMKYFAELGVSCIMLCGGNIFQIAANALLMWDKDLTEEEYWAFIEEQFCLYYGEGGHYLFECTEMIIYAGDLQGCWCSFSYSDLFDQLNMAYIESNFDYIEYLLLSAKSLAETKDIEERIEIFMGKIYYMCLSVTYDQNYHNGTEEERAICKERYIETHRIFRKYNLQTYLIPGLYAPEEIDFEKSPAESWAYPRYQES